MINRILSHKEKEEFLNRMSTVPGTLYINLSGVKE